MFCPTAIDTSFIMSSALAGKAIGKLESFVYVVPDIVIKKFEALLVSLNPVICFGFVPFL